MVGKAKSCTACRQAKMACDAQRKAPEPCSRCSSRGLQCRFDKNFKRVATRKIAQDIANELHILRAAENARAQHRDSSSPGPSAAGGTSPGSEARTVVDFVADMDGAEDLPTFPLGSLVLSPDAAIDLFRHFGRYYFPHAAFLQPVRSLSRLAADSPLLFWTILMIACQHHDVHRPLYEAVYPRLEEHLAPFVTSSIRRVEQIHALLLLCLWPVTSWQGRMDPTWSYVGLAVNAAMKMNFHKPIPYVAHHGGWHPWTPTASPSAQTQRLTWLACFNISTEISTFFGFVPPMSSPSHLKYARNAVRELGRSLPPDQQAVVAMNQVICSYAVALEDFEDTATYMKLVQTFDAAVDSVKEAHQDCWSEKLDLQFQHAKVNLYATAALMPPPQPSLVDAHVALQREQILQSGLGAARSMIRDVKTISLQPAANELSQAGMMSFFPRQSFTQLALAAAYMLRVFVAKDSASMAQKALAIEGLVDIHRIFKTLSNHRDKLRVTKMLAGLRERAQAGEQLYDTSGDQEFLVTNRLGASVLWDTILRVDMRERRSMQGSEACDETDAVPALAKMALDTALPVDPSMVPDPLLAAAGQDETAFWFPFGPHVDDTAMNLDTPFWM